MQKIIDARDNAINVMTPCPPQNSARRFVTAEEEDAEADATVFEAEDLEVVKILEELAALEVEEREEKEVEVKLPETMRIELPEAEAVVKSVLSVTRLEGRVVLPLAVVLAPLVVTAEELESPVMEK
jgi:hypothetical protein